MVVIIDILGKFLQVHGPEKRSDRSEKVMMSVLSSGSKTKTLVLPLLDFTAAPETPKLNIQEYCVVLSGTYEVVVSVVVGSDEPVHSDVMG